MKSLRLFLLTVTSLGLPGTVWAAGDCKNAYKQAFPYDLPLSETEAYVNFHSEVRVSYDCQAAMVFAGAEARAGIFDLGINLLQADAAAKVQQGKAPRAEARVLVMGFEVAHEDLDLGELLDVAISPEPELDVSGILTLNVGPVPVPIKYGITADARMNIKGGAKGFGLALNLVPAAAAKVYVQTGVDIVIAEAIARGEVVLIEDRLDNEIALLFEDGEQPFLRFEATSRNQIRALDGRVLVRARGGLGPIAKSYERDLFSWNGFEKNDLLFDYSERVALQK